MLVIITGYILVSIGGGIIASLQPEAELPAGWAIIRPPYEINDLIIVDDLVWAGGRDGVFLIDRIELKLIGELDLPREVDYVKALHFDHAGRLWIGHFNGLNIMDGDDFILPTEENGLPDSTVNCLYANSSGEIMVGTWGGVAIYDGHNWDQIDSNDGLLADMVNVIKEDSQGGLWFGHYVAPQGGLSYLRNGQWQYFTIDSGLPHNNITSIHEDDQGYIWVGTGLFERGGLVRFAFNGAEWALEEVITKEDGLAGEKVRYVFQDSADRFWITSEFDGAIVISPGNIFSDLSRSILITDEDGLANNEIKVMLEDVDGQIWFGTLRGVGVLDPSALKLLNYSSGP